MFFTVYDTKTELSHQELSSIFYAHFLVHCSFKFVYLDNWSTSDKYVACEG